MCYAVNPRGLRPRSTRLCAPTRSRCIVATALQPGAVGAVGTSPLSLSDKEPSSSHPALLLPCQSGYLWLTSCPRPSPNAPDGTETECKRRGLTRSNSSRSAASSGPGFPCVPPNGIIPLRAACAHELGHPKGVVGVSFVLREAEWLRPRAAKRTRVFRAGQQRGTACAKSSLTIRS